MGALSDRLGRLLNQRLPTVLNVAALLLLTSSLAQWTWQVVPTPAVPGPQRTVSAPAETGTYDLRALLDTNLFGQAARFSEPTQTPVTAIPTSTLDLTLTGVVAAEAESLALIRVNKDPETPFAIGDQIAHGVTLRAVYPDRAIIQRRELTEALLLEDKSAGLGDAAAVPAPSSAGAINSTGDNSFRVNRDFVADQLRNPDIFRQALIVPNAGGGFLVRQIQPGSLYEKLGLKVGDVIRKVNGNDINSVDEVLRLYQELGGVDAVADVELEVLRGGRPEQLRYTVQ
jgi:general secretion pathway protein C